MFIDPSELSPTQLRAIKSLFTRENAGRKNIISHGFVLAEFPISWKVIDSLKNQNLVNKRDNGEVMLTPIGSGIAKRFNNRPIYGY